MTTPLFAPVRWLRPERFAGALGATLQRLEWTTRYRPVHIQVLLLGGIAPEADAAFLYCPEGNYQGEAANLLEALRISSAGKSADAMLTEFQKRGLLLTHVLECPLEPGVRPPPPTNCLKGNCPPRLRASADPSSPSGWCFFPAELATLAGKFTEAALGSPVFTGSYGPFWLDGNSSESEMEAFRRALPTGTLL